MNNSEFISAKSLIAEVKEMMRSYFEAGLIDDLLFPVWIDDCLKRFSKYALPKKSVLLEVTDGKSYLPDDFDSVYAVWTTADMGGGYYKVPGSMYEQCTYVINESDDICDTCPTDCVVKCTEVTKTDEYRTFNFKRTFLLKPADPFTSNCCDDSCVNLHTHCPDTFLIKNNEIHIPYCEGSLYLKYYASFLYDEDKNIRNDRWLIDFIRKFLMFKCFEQLFLSVTDETFNQIHAKMLIFKQQQEEAFIVATIQSKKETIAQKQKAIKRVQNRYKYYRQVNGK